MTDFDAVAFCETLGNAAEAVGVPLTDTQITQCETFARLVLETNTHTNLTRITEAREMAIKHFADSLTALSPTPRNGERRVGGEGSLCDVGTGAGFPGMVLKIARPDLRLTLLDSLQKRLTFLESACKELGFPDVKFVHSRAEDAGRRPELRERFDSVTARAVASLPTLLEWCTPLVAVNGIFIAMKSGGVDEELASAQAAIAQLKVRLQSDRALTLPTLPDSEEPPAERRILTFRKSAATPARFPRTAAEIKRQPL